MLVKMKYLFLLLLLPVAYADYDHRDRYDDWHDRHDRRYDDDRYDRDRYDNHRRYYDRGYDYRSYSNSRTTARVYYNDYRRPIRYNTYSISYRYSPDLYDDDFRRSIRASVPSSYGEIERIEKRRMNGRDVWKVTLDDDGLTRTVYLRNGRIY